MKHKRPRGRPPALENIDRLDTNVSIAQSQGNVFADEYLNMNTLQRTIMTTNGIERLAFELVEWAKKDDSMMISQFVALKGLVDKTFSRWVEKFEVLADAHEFAKMQIGNRREVLLTEKDPSSLRITMPHYSKIWLQEDVRRNEAKKDIATKGSSAVHVYMEPVPDSPMVPHKQTRTPEEVASKVNVKTRQRSSKL